MKEEAAKGDYSSLQKLNYEVYKTQKENKALVPHDDGAGEVAVPFCTHFGIDCKGLPLHPAHLQAYHKGQGNKWPRLDGAEANFCCERGVDLGSPSRPALPCNALPRNVCPGRVGEKATQFRFLQKGLCNIVKLVKPAEAKQAECMYLLSTEVRGAMARVRRELHFLILALPIYSPEVQSWQLAELSTEDGEAMRLELETPVPTLPFFARLCSRASRVSQKRLAMDMETGDEVALRLLSACKITAFKLDYEVMENLRVSKVVGVSELGDLWKEGMPSPFGASARARPWADLKAMGSKDPFAPKGPATGGGGGRPGQRTRGGKLAGQGGQTHATAKADQGAKADSALQPGDAGEVFDLEAALAEEISEDVAAVAEEQEQAADASQEAAGHTQEYMRELAHAADRHAPEEWPAAPTAEEEAETAKLAADTQARLMEEEAQVEQQGTEGTPGMQAGPQTGSSSSGSSTEQRGSADEAANEAGVNAVGPAASLDNFTWSDPSDGGYISRNGVVIGRLTTFRNNLSIKCYLHGCALCMTSRVTCEDAARWVAAGQEVPEGLSAAERKAAKQRLKADHQAVPKPVPQPKPVSK